jgi:hypothetical protein
MTTDILTSENRAGPGAAGGILLMGGSERISGVR